MLDKYCKDSNVWLLMSLLHHEPQYDKSSYKQNASKETHTYTPKYMFCNKKIKTEYSKNEYPIYILFLFTVLC